MEAETHLRDLQAVERAIAAKRRDSRVDHVILLLADTHHNRAVLRDHRTSLRAEFPLTTREVLYALRAGSEPHGSGIAVLGLSSGKDERATRIVRCCRRRPYRRLTVHPVPRCAPARRFVARSNVPQDADARALFSAAVQSGR